MESSLFRSCSTPSKSSAWQKVNLKPSSRPCVVMWTAHLRSRTLSSTRGCQQIRAPHSRHASVRMVSCHRCVRTRELQPAIAAQRRAFDGCLSLRSLTLADTPPETWTDTESADALKFDMRVQADARRGGNPLRQNDILGTELGK